MNVVRAMVRAGVVIAALTVIVGAIFLGRAELAWRRADSLRTAGESLASVRAAREVFDLYVPGNPRLEDAARLIWETASAQEKMGEAEQALQSYRILRSGWIAAHPISGEGIWVTRCNRAIARLASGDRAGDHRTSGVPAGDKEAEVLATLQAPRRPIGVWGGLAALGFAGWVCATLGFIARGFAPDGLLRLPGLRWAAILVASYAVWILGLMRA